MFTGLFILFIKATTTTTSPLVTLPLPSPPHSSVDHGQHARHRPELYASLPYYFTARYFTHDQCGEWKNSDFTGEISYFMHELYAQNCIKFIEASLFVMSNYSAMSICHENELIKFFWIIICSVFQYCCKKFIEDQRCGIINHNAKSINYSLIHFTVFAAKSSSYCQTILQCQSVMKIN